MHRAKVPETVGCFCAIVSGHVDDFVTVSSLLIHRVRLSICYVYLLPGVCVSISYLYSFLCVRFSPLYVIDLAPQISSPSPIIATTNQLLKGEAQTKGKCGRH